jgi:uncharacterized membrane protein
VSKETAVATMTVWRFTTADGADNAMGVLQRLQEEELIDVLDGAVLTWPSDKRKPKMRQLHNLTRGGALGGAFWGFLVGLLFLVPLLGAAIGAASGAFVGSLADVGIDDDFMKRAREQITPGTSALFLLSKDAVLDKVRGAFLQTHPELIQTNLSAEDEARLRAAFAED